MQDHLWYEPLKPADEEKAKAAKPGPRFRIRMGSLLERAEFDAELDGKHQASPVPPFMMLEAAIAGVAALLDDAAAAEITELLRSFHGAPDGEEATELSPQEKAQVSEVQSILSDSWPPYNRLVERAVRYRKLVPLLALQRWVDDWENVTGIDGEPLTFERDKAGNIPDHVLRRLDLALIFAVGNRAHNFQYAVGEEKN
ncbi:MAG: hypothetical protein AAFY42_09575 [Pseudomonadota bacterium]